MINPTYKAALTKEPIYATRGITNSRLVKVLEIMLYGIPIKLGNYVYELVETEDGGFAPVIIINEEERLVMGQPDMSLMTFSGLVAKMDDEKYEKWVTEYAFSKTLMETFCKKREKVKDD